MTTLERSIIGEIIIAGTGRELVPTAGRELVPVPEQSRRKCCGSPSCWPNECLTAGYCKVKARLCGCDLQRARQHHTLRSA